jgi:predicted nucleic acid-binding protein
MKGFVLDCSIAVSWCFADEAAADTDALLEMLKRDGAIVPSLWHLELGNVLLQAEKRGRLSAMDTSKWIALFQELPIRTDYETTQTALRETLFLARAEGLTTYDAAYLELAMRHNLSLATKDKKLILAAQRVGVIPLPMMLS